MLLMVLVLVLLAGCASPAEIENSTNSLPAPTESSSPTTLPTQPIDVQPTATLEVTLSPQPTEREDTTGDLPDLSGLTLYQVTHLMDPRYFQVSLNGWPEGLPEDLIVRVDTEIYTCELLFPEEFPQRVYCWGLAPKPGKPVALQVILEDVARPLLEISFTVPKP